MRVASGVKCSRSPGLAAFPPAYPHTMWCFCEASSSAYRQVWQRESTWPKLEVRPAALLQVAPFDFLAEDAVLSAGEIARERREASMWLGDHVYALLPHACLILESVPHQGSCWDGTPLKPTAAAAPATTAAARSGSQHHCLL